MKSAVRTLFAAATIGLLVACTAGGNARDRRISRGTPMPSAVPENGMSSGLSFSNGPARAMLAIVRPLGVDPDGDARSLVRIAFRNASGGETRLLAGGDVRFGATGATIAWQTRSRFGGPAAIVRTERDAPTAISVSPSAAFALAALRLQADPGVADGTRIVASAVGPHLAQIGWFPAQRGAVRIERDSGREKTTTLVAAPGSGTVSTYRDPGLRAGTRYRYDVRLPSGERRVVSVATPFERPAGPLAGLSGKKMWLTFSPDRADDDAYDRLDPHRIATRASAAGLRAILLRVSYGEYDFLTPQVRPWLDALLDACADQHVALVAWTVPRRASFEEIERASAAARYRDARGNGFIGIAMDLERGGSFMGTGASARAEMIAYPARLRAALGRGYPLVATVEDPFVERVTDATYPFAGIARSVDVLQPMMYWRARPSLRGASAVASAVVSSLHATRHEAHRSIAVDLGAQSAAIEHGGAPSDEEIIAATLAAERAGALGVAYFAWHGTDPPQWAAIGATPWRDPRPSANALRDTATVRTPRPAKRMQP